MPRDRLESLGGTVEPGRELVGHDQDDDGVTVTVADRSTGAVEAAGRVRNRLRRARSTSVGSPGDRAPDAHGRDGHTGAPVRLFDLFRGTYFALLLFDGPAGTGAGHHHLASTTRRVRAVLGKDVRAYVVVPGDRRPAGLGDADVLLDPDRAVHRRYAAAAEALYLVRPDGYVAFRGQPSRVDVETPVALPHMFDGRICLSHG